MGYNISSREYIIYIKEYVHIEVSRDVIFDDNQAYKKSKNIPIDSDDEVLPIFEEEELQPYNPSTIQEIEEVPSEPIQVVVIPSTRRRKN